MSIAPAETPHVRGTMPLMAHLRELRTRLTRAVLSVAIGTAVAMVFYDEVLAVLTYPYEQIRPAIAAQGIESDLVITGIGGALQFQLKISLVAGLLVSSPAWLWQIWAFVLPALHRGERRHVIALTTAGAPLFLAGAALAYVILPTAMGVLIGFVPDGIGSLITGAEYFDFVIRMIVVFGLAAELPLAIILLHRIGALSARQLRRSRPWTFLAITVFSAVATPTTDPITMLFLAAPMVVLYGVAEIVVALSDRRASRRASQASSTGFEE